MKQQQQVRLPQRVRVVYAALRRKEKHQKNPLLKAVVGEALHALRQYLDAFGR